MSKIGVAVNPKALLMSSADPVTDPTNTDLQNTDGTTDPTGTEADTKLPTPSSDPKASVSKFLNNLSSQNLRSAYDVADNPNWGSYETFSNPTSGFGGLKSIYFYIITSNTASANTASVNATYDITDKEGRVTAVQVTFGLKNVNGDWKISSYKIN